MSVPFSRLERSKKKAKKTLRSAAVQATVCSDWLSEHVMLASRVNGAGRRGKERKKVYLPRDCCEVIRPRNMKPPAGSVGGVGGGIEGNNKTRQYEKEEMYNKREKKS